MPRRRCTQTKPKQKQKRGNKGYFLGAPLDLLEPYAEKYFKSVGHRSNFWAEFRGEWDTTYPSNLTEEEIERVEEIKLKYNLEPKVKTKRAVTPNEDTDETDDEDDEGGDDDGEGDTGEKVTSTVANADPKVSANPDASMDPDAPVANASVNPNASDTSPTDTDPPNIPDTGPITASTSGEASNVKKKSKAKQKEPVVTKKRKRQDTRTEEENVLLARAATPEKLRSWFSNRSTKEKNNRQKDLEDLVTALNKQALGSPPRLATDYRFYQTHPDFQDKASKEYYKRYPKDGNFHKDHLKNYGMVARSLFEKESAEVKKRIRAEAQEEYENALEAYAKKSALDIFDTSDKDLLERRRVQMAPLLQNFLQGIGKARQTKISMVIMGESLSDEEDKIFTSSVQVGATPGENPKRFHEWDPYGFKMLHVKSFAEFFRACVRLEKGLEATPPTYSKSRLQEAESIPTPSIPEIVTEKDEEEDHGNGDKGKDVKGKGKAKATTSKKRKRQEDETADSDSDDSPDLDDSEEEEEDNRVKNRRRESTPPVTPKLKKTWKIEKELQAELSAMSNRERRLRMRDLSTMGKDDFWRANVDAKNRAMMNSVGATQAARELEEMVKRSKAKKGAVKPKPKPKPTVEIV
ncbi:hypothetical protein K435DRAFT_795190, partial [Dendrothele bispora CBS 962.96]